jgi:hypothetical protein
LSSTCKVKSGSFIIKAKSTANGKLAAESKIRKCQCCKGNVHILLVLISEKRLNGFLAVAKNQFSTELILQVRV